MLAVTRQLRQLRYWRRCGVRVHVPQTGSSATEGGGSGAGQLARGVLGPAASQSIAAASQALQQPLPRADLAAATLSAAGGIIFGMP
eukprot:tig00000215_g18575.t1